MDFSVLVLDLLGYLVSVAFVLHLLDYRRFQTYVDKLLILIYLPTFYTAALLLALPNILLMVLKSLPKAVATIGLILVLIPIYLLTKPIPAVGKRIQSVNTRLHNGLENSTIAVRARWVRSELVEIVAENYDGELHYHEDESYRDESYRDEIVRIRKKGVSQLETGESVMSLSMGGLLIVTQTFATPVFQLEILGIPVSLVIELYLLMIAISIAYRTMFLDLLAYDGTEEFDSLNEMEVALKYQKATTFAEVAQGGLLVVVVIATIAHDKFKVAIPVLEKQNSEDLSPLEVLSLAWHELQSRKQNQKHD